MSRLVKLIKRFWKSPDYGAEAPVWLAIDAALNNVNGQYFNEKKVIEYSELAKNEELRKGLRNLTLALLKNVE